MVGNECGHTLGRFHQSGGQIGGQQMNANQTNVLRHYERGEQNALNVTRSLLDQYDDHAYVEHNQRENGEQKSIAKVCIEMKEMLNGLNVIAATLSQYPQNSSIVALSFWLIGNRFDRL